MNVWKKIICSDGSKDGATFYAPLFGVGGPPGNPRPTTDLEDFWNVIFKS